MIGRRWGFAGVVMLVLASLPTAAFAQGWSFDARTIAMGGVGGSGNLASSMIDQERDYSSIVLPLGLIQILSDSDVFNPDSDKFDPILAVEYAATPFAFVIGRGSSSNSGQTAFVNDVRNATLSRDLTRYKGFVPANDILAEGLATPNFGKTIKFAKKDGGGFQGVYIGVGPYLSMHSDTTISTDLTTVLSTGVNKANASFPITESDEAQFAGAFTLGYRGRFPWPEGTGSGSDRDGLYVAVNYNFLHGFGYTNDTMAVSFLTDNAGLVRDASNIVIDHKDASSGSGMAIDLGAGAVIGPWEFGGGVRGLANHMTWTDAEQKTLTLPSLTSNNSDFVEGPTTKLPDVRVELKKDYRGSAAYRGETFAVAGEVGDGFGGASFHGGVEKKLGVVDVRGGARYTVKKWNPTAGVGFNVSPRVSFDVAVFGTNANVERTHETAIAASIRINHPKM